MGLGFNTLRYETTLDGPGDLGAGISPQPQLNIDPDGPPPGAPPPAAEQQGWQGVTEEQWDQYQQVVQQQNEMLQRLAPVAEYLENAPQPQIDGQTYLRAPDPYESQNFQADLEQYVTDRITQAQSPYADMMQQQRMEQLESSARDMIHDVIQTQGELLNPQYGDGQQGLAGDDLILQFAKAYSPMMVAQYGEGLRADEAAIGAAYEEIKAYNDAIIAAHEARQTNQINALRGAPREPGYSGVAAQPESTTVEGGMAAFKQRWDLP